MADAISAPDAFSILARRLQRRSQARALDVRSEGEFAEGCFPLVENRPILSNEHRHLVGLCYKKSGQEAAIDLAMKLVSPLRESMVQGWAEQVHANQERGEETLLFCWRGGLRSKTACSWLSEVGLRALRVEGGFKALRRESLRVLGQLPPLIVLSGMTGSGKTRLLTTLPQHLDLEGIAGHRGSAFGLLPDEAQPTQLGFENHLALKLGVGAQPLVVEDESRRIGRVQLPEGMYEFMAGSPFVLLEVSVEDRANHIFAEYIEAQLAQGTSQQVLHEHMRACTERIRRKLGGLKTDQVLRLLDQAFAAQDSSAHQAWIMELLIYYYDPLYRFAMERKNVKPTFVGGPEECREYLLRLTSADQTTVHA